MPKVTLDMGTFKALASDTRLDILRALDGKKLSLKDISKATKLNKATLHEHLSKLNEAGLVKRKEREGHKWVYYRLSWKGESLLHPENTRIVVLFSATFVALAAGVIQMINYVKGTIVGADNGFLVRGENESGGYNVPLVNDGDLVPFDVSYGTGSGGEEGLNILYDPNLLYIALICFAIFTIVLSVTLWRYWNNKQQKL